MGFVLSQYLKKLPIGYKSFQIGKECSCNVFLEYTWRFIERVFIIIKTMLYCGTDSLLLSYFK